jgi:hypothetical protein
MNFFKRFIGSRSRSVALPNNSAEILARLTELDQEVRQLTKRLKPEERELAENCEKLSELFRLFPESFNSNAPADRDREALDVAIAALSKLRTSASSDPLVTRLLAMSKLAAWSFERAKEITALKEQCRPIYEAGQYRQVIPLMERLIKLDPTDENLSRVVALTRKMAKVQKRGEDAIRDIRGS